MKKLFYHDYARKYMFKWLIVATLVGLGGGVSALALKKSIDLVTNISKYIHVGISPLIGGILVSIVYLWDKKASGFGTNDYIYEVNSPKKYLSVKTLFSKIIATSITLGFQGSGGVEGPMLVIGGSIADLVAKIPFIKNFFDEEDRRILTICGAAGAVGAIFKSPLGGGIFVVELLYRSSLNYADLFPAMLSSTMGFAIYSMFTNSNPLFHIPDYIPNVYNVPLFIIAALISGFISIVFKWFFQKAQKLFAKIPYKKFHPILGGAITGIILLVLPEVGGTGDYIIQDMIDINFPIRLLILLAIGKTLATSFTVASGGSAGLVIPALFMGAIAGNGFSTFIHNIDPALSSSLVISGMSASLASLANVPVASAIMLVEMVGLRLGIPATIGSILGFVIGNSKLIYDSTCPDEREFLEIKKWKDFDINGEES